MPQSAGGRGRDYRESDVLALFRRGEDWQRWSDAVAWLRQSGSRDERMRGGDVRALLIRDFQRLEEDQVPFTHEPGQAFKLARGHRPHGLGIERG